MDVGHGRGFLKRLIGTLTRASVVAAVGCAVCLSSCSSVSSENALSRAQQVVRVSSTNSTSRVTPLPIHPCSYLSLESAEGVTGGKLTETIDRTEQTVGYSVCQYNGTRRTVHVDISSLRPDSSSTLVKEILKRTFGGFPRPPIAVPDLGQEAFTDADSDPRNGYINLVYVFAQHGLLAETIAVVGTDGASTSDDSLRIAEFAMAKRL